MSHMDDFYGALLVCFLLSLLSFLELMLYGKSNVKTLQKVSFVLNKIIAVEVI